jgi:hypothetical protein
MSAITSYVGTHRFKRERRHSASQTHVNALMGPHRVRDTRRPN